MSSLESTFKYMHFFQILHFYETNQGRLMIISGLIELYYFLFVENDLRLKTIVKKLY